MDAFPALGFAAFLGSLAWCLCGGSKQLENCLNGGTCGWILRGLQHRTSQLRRRCCWKPFCSIPDQVTSSTSPLSIHTMSAPDGAQTSTINLDSMSLEELNQVKQQEEQRLQALTNRYAVLRQAAARLHASQMAISELTPESEGKEVMVPLTESVYVPGKIREPNNLLVDLGTGFYCEKNSKDTTAFLERKLKIVDANSENVTTAAQVTKQNIESLTMTMQGKMMEIRARQEGQRHKAQIEGQS